MNIEHDCYLAERITMAVHIPPATAMVMAVVGVSASAAALTAGSGEEVIIFQWSLPLTCVSGAVMGGLLAVIMTPRSIRTVRGEAIRWLGATITGLVFGPLACQLLPSLGLRITADTVLATSGLLGFLAWPIMGQLHSTVPSWAKAVRSRYLGVPDDETAPACPPKPHPPSID